MSEAEPRPEVAAADLPAFLPRAARLLRAPFAVRVAVLARDENVVSTDKRRRESTRSRALIPQGAPSESTKEESLGTDDDEEPPLRLAAVLDAGGALVELAARRTRLPCLLLKLLALRAPQQPHLARLTLRACRLDGRALHQLEALLLASRVSELCLDESRVSAGGFHLLLRRPSALARLSLDRCALGDDGAAAVAAALRHPLPASETLRSLSLASNGIGDEGARALGAALRSNRALRHLNLASNFITDSGAAHIIASLGEFEVTAEETLEARRRSMERSRRRRSVSARALAELEAERPREPSRRCSVAARKKSRMTLGNAKSGAGAGRVSPTAQAEAATRRPMRPFSEPLGDDQTELRDGVRYSTGNAALCWLNLAYNSLGQGSVEALERALDSQAGLLRLALDGNPLPASAALAARLDAALDRGLRRQTLVAKSLHRSQKI